MSTENLHGVPLLEFIPRLSPNFSPPYHLKEWCSLIEDCLRGGVRGLVAVPIRHHKTWTTLHGVAWLLVQRPNLRIILMCADHERALELGKMCRRLCEAAGIGPVRGDNTIVDWKNQHGGGVCVMSAEQSRLGRDVDVLIFDDPITELTAEDATVRDAVDHAIAHYTARAGRPDLRGSVLGVMSPWHPDDPMGRRRIRKAEKWTYVSYPVISVDETGAEKAFCPEIMTVEEIHRRREEMREVDPSERLWWAQFMVEPRASVDAKFKAPARYETMPAWGGYRWGMGLDFSYTVGDGDWFALTAAKFYASDTYLDDVIRVHADFATLENLIRNRWDRYGRCPIFSYIAGPEKGAVNYFASRGIPVIGIPARYSKATRAQRTIDRWNTGRILVPLHASWVTGFLSRVQMFTGHEKARDDDEIDALVSMCDGMLGSGVADAPKAFGVRSRA